MILVYESDEVGNIFDTVNETHRNYWVVGSQPYNLTGGIDISNPKHDSFDLIYNDIKTSQEHKLIQSFDNPDEFKSWFNINFFTELV
jgi:hypothetical protein